MASTAGKDGGIVSQSQGPDLSQKEYGLQKSNKVTDNK